jgi:hypothetical protein
MDGMDGDPYLHPGTSVLRNKARLLDPDALRNLEYSETGRRAQKSQVFADGRKRLDENAAAGAAPTRLTQIISVA